MGDKIRRELSRYMTGRNGIDALGRATIGGALVLYVLRGIMGAVLRSALFGGIFGLLYTVLAVVSVYRALSRDLPRRRAENDRFLSMGRQVAGRVGALRQEGSGAAARLRDREHRYFKCQDCGTMCRVPKGKGKIVITCPKCGAKIEARS